MFLFGVKTGDNLNFNFKSQNLIDSCKQSKSVSGNLRDSYEVKFP